MSKIDLRVAKTLHLIDATCYELLTTTSFDKLTVAQICQQAQLGRSTFYQHYLDKYDWLEQQVDHYTTQFEQIMQQRRQTLMADDSLTQLVTALLPARAQLLILWELHLPTADLIKNYRQILAETLPQYLHQAKLSLSVPIPYLQQLYATNALTYIQYSVVHGLDAQISAFMNQNFKLVLQGKAKLT
ncbi:TetR/AcrR family transcriptional regulator [Lactiplantibacillus mudanjiangensis]|uniref:HTH tetR-type domain-containing protein n=1 Tax=Lactiplantibacillus mudanjiangensis TaxID=1296538 RepID=A0A660DY77_9LACO|nr:TetR/AcrR family transcriptional regulator [Lactiplantibacillus mudanjiangensis]VDG19435.1 hypothetical protein [Lactobacillus ginsenosidimutans] [Lactiplantibacillus mudanjiangensis]VDG24994.1 hypothetical protein [Lactobacillus ginsenosidimutans] [Lactiplantibacillus mudanjiangensis]VDG27985.1 hypothetical protein [Lactobacillus ginsenosidimutans] [Lactiplantibacillus mudanjiangensis]VDG30889.1 hypothetical protein [Lactobacillus ginsenosidimutans] [Lactiplantibacillus mudanjiangensis]